MLDGDLLFILTDNVNRNTNLYPLILLRIQIELIRLHWMIKNISVKSERLLEDNKIV